MMGNYLVCPVCESEMRQLFTSHYCQYCEDKHSVRELTNRLEGEPRLEGLAAWLPDSNTKEEWLTAKDFVAKFGPEARGVWKYADGDTQEDVCKYYGLNFEPQVVSKIRTDDGYTWKKID